MGQTGDTKRPFLRRHRRGLIALCVLAALAGGGWVLAERYLLDMERYRQFTIDFLAERIGIDAQIGRIEVDLVPTPRAIVYDAALRTPQARADVSQVIAKFDLARLLRREIGISDIDVEGLVLRVIDDPNAVLDLINGIQQTWESTRKGDGGGDSAIDVALDRIRADRVDVWIGDTEDAFGTLDVEIDDVLSDRIRIGVRGDLSAAGDDARLDGDVVVILNREAKRWQIAGSVDVTGAELNRLPRDNAPQGVLNANLKFTPGEGRVAATLRASIASNEHPALTGDIESDAVWTGDAFQVTRATWDAAGATIDASGEFESADAWRARVKQARMTEGVLDALLAMAERPQVKFEAEPGGYIDVKDIDIGPAEEGPVRLASGTADFTALAVVPKGEGAEERAARGIRGNLSVADNVITIAEIRTDAAKLSGTIVPDFDNAAAKIDIAASADLGRLPWEAFDALAAIQRLDGDLTVTKLAGTFSEDGGIPDDFVLNADLAGAAAIYADETVRADVRDLSGKFTSGGTAIDTQLGGTMSNDTPFTIAGAYDIAARTWTGVVSADVGAIGPTVFADADLADMIRPVAETLSASEFDIKVALLAKERDTALIEVNRRGELPLYVQTSFDGEGSLHSVTGRGTLPVETMAAEYFPRLIGTGYAGFSVDYRPIQKQMSATLDLTACAIQSYSILEKPDGVPVVGRVELDLGEKMALRSLVVDVEEVPVIATTDEPQNGVIPLEIDLPILAPILVDGAAAGGTVFVRHDMNAGATELRFERVSIAIDDRVALDRVDGLLQIFQNSIATDGLEIHGARSDCTLRLAKVGDSWTGGLEGRSFNLHAITELIDAGRALIPEDDDAVEDETSLWDQPLLGEFAVDLGTVYYNRGHLDDVKFRLLGEDRAIRVRDLAVTPYAGTLTGSVAIVPADDADARLKLTMNATDLDARTLNDLMWATDQGLFGTLTGAVTFDAPLGEMKSMLAAGDGSVAFKGTKGSLGQTGFATKLLTALKTTDILNLRLHSLRDQGLTFETWDVDLRMDDGFMGIHTFTLDGGGYGMTGEGAIDFAKEDTNAVINVMPLESFSRAMKRVPILGNIAAAVSTDLVAMPVRFSGSPYDVKASIAKELAKNVLTAPLRAGGGAIKSVPGVGNSNGNKIPERKEDPKDAPTQETQPEEQSQEAQPTDADTP